MIQPANGEEPNLGDAIRQAIEAALAEGEDLIAAELQALLRLVPTKLGGSRDH